MGITRAPDGFLFYNTSNLNNGFAILVSTELWTKHGWQEENSTGNLNIPVAIRKFVTAGRQSPKRDDIGIVASNETIKCKLRLEESEEQYERTKSWDISRITESGAILLPSAKGRHDLAFMTVGKDVYKIAGHSDFIVVGDEYEHVMHREDIPANLMTDWVYAALSRVDGSHPKIFYNEYTTDAHLFTHKVLYCDFVFTFCCF